MLRLGTAGGYLRTSHVPSQHQAAYEIIPLTIILKHCISLLQVSTFLGLVIAPLPPSSASLYPGV